MEIVNLAENFKTFRLIYKSKLTSHVYKYDILFNKYNEELDAFDRINIYDLNLNKTYNNRDIYSYLNDPIINKILKLFIEYTFYNLHPIKEIKFDKLKPKTKVSNDINKLLLKCYQKESEIKEIFKFTTHLVNNEIDLNNSENISIVCDYKNTEHIQIILELCSNRLSTIKTDVLTLDTNIVICNKYHIYKWEKIKNKNIKIVTTDSELNNFEDIKKYKIIILLDKVLLYFIEFSKQKKYKYTRFIFQALLSFNCNDILNDIVYSVYLFLNKKMLMDLFIGFNDNKYSYYKCKLFYIILNKLVYLNNKILHNEKFKIDNNTINSYLEYLNNIILLKDTKNDIQIIDKYNYHIIKHNYGIPKITDKVIELLEDNKVEDIIHTNNIFELKNYDTEFIEEKLKDVCCICLEQCDKATITSCCNQLFCLKCNLYCLKEKLACALCRTTIDSRNKINIVKNHLELKEKQKVTCVEEVKSESEIYNKKYILEKTIEYILSNSEWNRKIIIVNNFGEGVYGDYGYYRESREVKDVLAKYDINSYNVFKFSLNCIKRKMKEFNTIGGVLIIPNMELFNKLNSTIYTDYIIHYHNIENNNIYNENRDIYNTFAKDRHNPLEELKNCIVNENVTVFDLVI